MSVPVRRLRSVALISVADQITSSATNVLVVVSAARAASSSDFGAFSVAYVVYVLVAGLVQALVGQVLVLEDAERARALTRGVLRTVGTIGVGTSALLLAGLVVVDLPGAGALRALAFVLPVLLLQDCLRFAFAAMLAPARALLSDLTWLAAVVAVLVVVPHGADGATLVVIWGLSAVPALLVALVGAVPALRAGAGATLGLRRRRYLGHRFGLEFVLVQSGSQIPIAVFGALGDVVLAAALRATATLFGPLNVLYNAMQNFAAPVIGQSGSDARRSRLCLLVSGATAALAGLWATLLATLPTSWGAQVLGATWTSAQAVIPAIGVQYVALAFVFGGRTALRLRAPRASLPVQAVASTVALGLVVVLYVAAGVGGMAWALAAGSTVHALIVWVTVLMVRRSRRDEDGRCPVAAHGAERAVAPSTSVTDRA